MPLRVERIGLVISAIALGLGGAGAARASFHFMQIEQVVGGVCGDASLQAVQLRMRLGGQHLISQGRLRFHDEQGTNSTVLLDIASNLVGPSAAGDRILIATADFTSRFGITPDATIATPIPFDLYDAGRLTFESDGGIIYWSLAWGGAGYTGSSTGNTINDSDGDFGPPYAGALPSSTNQALLFGGTAGDQSTTNATDYALTSGTATFTNYTGTSVTLGSCVFGDGFESGDTSLWASASP